MNPDASIRPNEPDLRPSLTAATTDDLAWDAFRYVADAMTPVELEDFEERLFHDQVAREAVADAVDRLGSIQIVAREVVTRSPAWGSFRTHRRRSRAWTALGSVAMAAAILLVACWGPGWVVRQGSIAAAIDVALAWSHLRSDALSGDASPPLSDFGPTEIPSTAEVSMIDASVVEPADVSAERPLPSWMVAAVSPDPDADAHRPEDN